ncbi:hypothetical protein llap_16928 [Limosa lapponica baueri]|uniref:Zinc finger protein 777-like n=1 Tax=Limosa lapponica baueri TaxID=1758121 RepID=A0A2I0TG45_LIMLA|nr:hypothetical protein llap_16928 [Limosa lapponica baueri]
MGPRATARQAEAQQLQELRSRTEKAERRLLACENLVGELGNNLATLGNLLQDYGHLQQRLDNVENLLKNRNFWILRLPPSSRGEIPKVPLTFDDISVYFNEEEWERLERWQKDLYRAVMRGNYEMLVSLDYAVSKPDILSRMERDEELCVREGQELPMTGLGKDQEPRGAPEEERDQTKEPLGEDELPVEFDTDDDVSKPDALSWIERDEEHCIQEGQESPLIQIRDDQEFPQTNVTGGQKSPETSVPDGQKSPQTSIQDGQKSSQTNVPDDQKSPQTSVPDGQKSPQTSIQDGQKSPQTNVPDCQKTPQTDVPDGQKSPQTPEEMDQKEKALGEDKVPMEADTELPILVMNIMSLSAQDKELRGEDGPEEEMEEDPAEPSPEEGFLPGNEAACEGASPPENLKMKEEEPEALQEVSSSSPSLEMQKCPKSEQGKPKRKKKPSRCTSRRLLMGSCRGGDVREWSHPCTECGKRFRLKINLIIHQRSHAKEGPYECAVCEISFADKHHLDLHQSIHVKDRAFGAKVWGNVHPELRIRPRRKFHGAFCGEANGLSNGTYSGGGAWLGQAKEELDRGSLPSTCFSRQQSPRSHRKPEVKCIYCKKILSCTFSLQRHLQTHMQERPYCCTACNKCFTRSTHLSRHQKIHDRQKALAKLQQPVTVTPASRQPQPRAAPKPPHSSVQEPKKNVATVATEGVPANVVLLGPAELGALDNDGQIWGGRSIQPVVRLRNRVVVSEN